MNGWMLLGVGIVFEVAGTCCLKLSQGFSNPLATTLSFAFFAVALSFITYSAKTLDISIVYAIWSAAGIILITIIGAFFFCEPLSLQKMVYITLILIGVIGLHHTQSNIEATESKRVHSLK